jgi:hypothetical protein
MRLTTNTYLPVQLKIKTVNLSHNLVSIIISHIKIDVVL